MSLLNDLNARSSDPRNHLLGNIHKADNPKRFKVLLDKLTFLKERSNEIKHTSIGINRGLLGIKPDSIFSEEEKRDKPVPPNGLLDDAFGIINSIMDNIDVIGSQLRQIEDEFPDTETDEE